MNAKKLLIVNYEQEAFGFLSATPEEYGFQVSNTDSAEKALSMVSSDFYDIILCDVNMPGMNGVELFRKIKKISPLSSVVLMSAASRNALTSKTVDEGSLPMDGKLFKAERILAAIDAAADRAGIIVATNNNFLAAILPEQLGRRNINALTTADAEETIEAVKRFHPDIVFIDEKISGMDAFELLKTIRAMRPYLDVVMLLEQASPLSKQLCISNGAVNWIEPPLTSDKITAATEIIRTKQNIKFEPFKILLVEDDSGIAETIAGILADNGYEVDCFENGALALTACKENRYHALVCDYRLPALSGIEVIKSVKQLQPGIVTILMTAYESMDVAVSAICEEVNDFLPKPFDPSSLLRSLRKALSAKNPK
jgi:DNA-binding NtrC family response regulator